jgi:hypothetical protein
LTDILIFTGDSFLWNVNAGHLSNVFSKRANRITAKRQTAAIAHRRINNDIIGEIDIVERDDPCRGGIGIGTNARERADSDSGRSCQPYDQSLDYRGVSGGCQP